MAGTDIRPAVLAALVAACLSLGGPGTPAAEPFGQAVEVADPAALIPRIEMALGRPLTEDEQVRCLEAGRRVIAAAREQQLVFVHELADLFRFAPELLASELPPPTPQGGELTPHLVPRIEELLARPLAAEEVERIVAIEQVNRTELEPARAAFAHDLAAAVGLAPDAVLVMLSDATP